MLSIFVVEGEQNEHSPTQRYFLSVNGTLNKKNIKIRSLSNLSVVRVLKEIKQSTRYKQSNTLWVMLSLFHFSTDPL